MAVASTNVFTYSCITIYCMFKYYKYATTCQNRAVKGPLESYV